MSIYNRRPSFIYGFHGLDKKIAYEILLQQKSFEPSDNNYDWLGKGIYFWENNIERAKQYAIQTSKRKYSSVETPFVLGAIIDLGNCLDLLDQKYLDYLETSYQLMVEDFSSQDKPIPCNKGFGAKDLDFKNRKLDCAVINYAHMLAEEQGVVFDTVRSAFLEGESVYPNAGFKRHNHIQISVLNSDCIKGVFLPKNLT